MSMIGNFLGVTENQLQSLLAAPEGIGDFLYNGTEPRRELDVDKAWHVIHFLLCGDVGVGEFPLSFILDGQEIGDIDVGYGPARGFTSAQVHAIDDALRGIDAGALMTRWDSQAMRDEGIYGVDPDRPDEETEYIVGYYEDLRRFIADLASANMALVVYLN
jgi:hypothetical protein